MYKKNPLVKSFVPSTHFYKNQHTKTLTCSSLFDFRTLIIAYCIILMHFQYCIFYIVFELFSVSCLLQSNFDS